MYFIFLLILFFFAPVFFAKLIGLCILTVKNVLGIFKNIKSSFKNMKQEILFKIRGYEKVEEPSYDFDKMRKNIKDMK